MFYRDLQVNFKKKTPQENVLYLGSVPYKLSFNSSGNDGNSDQNAGTIEMVDMDPHFKKYILNLILLFVWEVEILGPFCFLHGIAQKLIFLYYDF